MESPIMVSRYQKGWQTTQSNPSASKEAAINPTNVILETFYLPQYQDEQT